MNRFYMTTFAALVGCSGADGNGLLDAGTIEQPGDDASVVQNDAAPTEDATTVVDATAEDVVHVKDVNVVDVGAKLESIGQTSRYFLRVTISEKNASDGTPPVLVHYRQLYDCVPGQ